MTPAVAELAALTRWTRPRTATDWLPVERRLGLPVPASFKELAETFGPGEFSQYLFLAGPGDERAAHSLARESAAWLFPGAADLLHPTRRPANRAARSRGAAPATATFSSGSPTRRTRTPGRSSPWARAPIGTAST
ncbi:hypothetical protein ACFQ2M_40810 [Kitasatospora saccharophila]|uniref:hypothetical protein n=1 Tax=Kitasatospora saccharophila TaxID=407973 RepID=UPI00362A24A5